MEQPVVRIAILGFGHFAGRRLAPAFARSRHAALTGIWRRDATAAARNCAEFKIPHQFATREELCSSSEVDVVFITSPDSMHKEDAMLAIRHGKAVLCEKPLAMNATEAAEMAAAARAAGVVFGVGQNCRYSHSLEWLRAQVRSGVIGEPLFAMALYSYQANLSPRRWIMNAELACGGPIGDVGVHCMDALRFVLDREITNVHTLARRTALSGGVEATASLHLEMTGGLYATVGVSAWAPYRTAIEITGSNGTLIAENVFAVDGPVDLVLRRAGAVVETVTVRNEDVYTRMLDGFAAAYRGQEEFAAPGEDGVKNMRALDAAYESWRSGIPEPVLVT